MEFEEEDDVLLKEPEKDKTPVANKIMEVVLIIMTVAMFLTFFLIVVVF
ncbi:MAG: hypothetical protein WDO15_16555 [Bacteroidota bacterium]